MNDPSANTPLPGSPAPGSPAPDSPAPDSPAPDSPARDSITPNSTAPEPPTTDSAAAPAPSITESPWYWVYLFCIGALVALLLMGPKFRARQAQIERKYQGRQRAVRQASGESPTTPLSETGETLIDLRPLYAIVLVALTVGGVGLWLRRRGPLSPTARGPTP